VAKTNLLDQLFELSVDVIFSLSVPDGVILSLSPAFSNVTGWAIDDWVGKPFIDLIHPEDQQDAITSFTERLNGGGPGPASWRVKTAKGEYLMAEFTSSLVYDGGKLTSIVGIARDISERQRVEDELASRSRQVMHILESISDGFYLLDNEWRYVMINKTAEKVAGKSKSSLIGKIFWEVRSKSTVDHLSKQFHAAKDTEKEVVFEEYDNDLQRWYEIRAYPHFNGLAVYFTDISLRKRAEDQLKKHSEGIEKILADILGIQEKWR
jgi:PAS domain S-box-containing protein